MFQKLIKKLLAQLKLLLGFKPSSFLYISFKINNANY